MRYGYWMPVFGGWLRNVDDEQMAPTWDYVSRLARRSEKIGFDLTLIAELNLNDIKGVDAPSLDAWSTAAALAAVTESLELMVAVRPTFHLPALLAKQAANIDNISQRPRFAERGFVLVGRGSEKIRRAIRSARRSLRAHLRMAGRGGRSLEAGPFLVQREILFGARICVLQPKPVSKPRPVIYAGGESEAAKELISQKCDAYVMHGDPPDRIAPKIRDMSERRERKNLPPMKYGVAGLRRRA